MFVTKEELEKDGHETVIASTVKGICPGSRGGFATATLTSNEVKTGDYDAVVFVAGGGSKVYFANEEVFHIAKEMHKRKTVVAAICLAPVILANAGVLKGKNVTVVGTEAKTIEKKGSKIYGTWSYCRWKNRCRYCAQEFKAIWAKNQRTIEVAWSFSLV